MFATFWSQGNEQLLEHLKGTARGAVRGMTWLAGPHASGKSHLLQATCAAAPAARRCGFFPLAQLQGLGPAALEGLPRLELVCLDDVQLAAGNAQWEQALFGLYREIDECGGSLIAAAPEPPALLPWGLKDLASRFAAATIHALRPLDEAAHGPPRSSLQVFEQLFIALRPERRENGAIREAQPEKQLIHP